MYISDISRCHGNGNQIYSIVMATGYIQNIARRRGNGGLVCPIVVAICLGTFQEHSIFGQ